jgi:hypothetical protein
MTTDRSLSEGQRLADAAEVAHWEAIGDPDDDDLAVAAVEAFWAAAFPDFEDSPMALDPFSIPAFVEPLVGVKSAIATPRPDGLPWVGKIVVGRTNFVLPGKHVTIGVKGPVRTIAGLYGPNPPMISGLYGKLASPAAPTPAQLHHWNSRNCQAGTYYLVIYEQGPNGRFGGLTAPVEYQCWLGNWRVW